MAYEFITWFSIIFLKRGKQHGKIVLKLFTIFIVVERQFPPFCLHPNMELFPGIIDQAFIVFTLLSMYNHRVSREMRITVGNEAVTSHDLMI